MAALQKCGFGTLNRPPSPPIVQIWPLLIIICSQKLKKCFVERNSLSTVTSEVDISDVFHANLVSVASKLKYVKFFVFMDPKLVYVEVACPMGIIQYTKKMCDVDRFT